MLRVEFFSEFAERVLVLDLPLGLFVAHFKDVRVGFEGVRVIWFDLVEVFLGVVGVELLRLRELGTRGLLGLVELGGGGLGQEMGIETLVL